MTRGKSIIELSQIHGINSIPVFPSIEVGGCTLTCKSAYVICSDGEIYKCWRDVGNKKEILGNVDCLTDWNLSLLAEGMIWTPYLEDDDCEACLFFPICNGGCPKMRQYSIRDGKKETCVLILKNIMKNCWKFITSEKLHSNNKKTPIVRYIKSGNVTKEAEINGMESRKS